MKTLGDSGFTSSTARAQSPATVGLVYKNAGKLTNQLSKSEASSVCTNCVICRLHFCFL